jgi:phosphoribosylformylglycinamidine (FGAM) synthase-like amidotransferase family enzyme/selenophosphate synthetase-related protein
MSIGIIRYPGSNCDFDALKYFDKSFFIWHKETKFPENMRLLVLPGGFAFGDRVYNKATDTYTISPGTKAILSPVTTIIMEAVKRNIPILGICNGFQILIQLGLLPGKLELNNNGKFTCKQVQCRVNYINYTYFTYLYIANSYGRYKIDYNEYLNMMENKQIFLQYNETINEVESNHNIAGISNVDNTIFGMMPHPERNNQDYKKHLYHILSISDLLPVSTQITPLPVDQLLFQKKINELMHSEHISYKSTRKYLKTLYTQAPWVVQGPGENAGIVDIGDGYCIALRIESHNHPTFINPFEGAATGVGGIMRDIFTMGARPIAILDYLRFGTDEHSKNLLEKAIDGISYYGNCVGVPNVGGDCYLNSSYNKNPLVNVGCIGIVKKDNIIYGNATDSKQLLIYVGSKTGNEGIGGAAMASNTFNSETDINDMQQNVQKSDPYLEKLLLEACCEIAERKLVIGMQDMGAGGLLCASHEIVRRGMDKSGKNLGCNIYLDKVPTKYRMTPVNILISESQERMLIIATENNKKDIFEIFNKWDLEYAVIGETNLSGKYSIYYEKTFLYTDKMSNCKDVIQDWDYINNTINSELKSNTFPKSVEKVKNMDLWKVYDSTVGNRTIKGPNKPGSYSILDIPENNTKLVLTWAENFNDCYIKMVELVAEPLCIVNCLNFGHPQDAMCDFAYVVKNLSEQCKKYNVPVVGGNVSLYNSTDNKSIRPTPVLLMMGIIRD